MNSSFKEAPGWYPGGGAESVSLGNLGNLFGFF